MKTISKTIRNRVISLAAALIFAAPVFFNPVFAADDDITLSQSSLASGYEDGRATLSIKITNNTGSDIENILITADNSSFYISDNESTVSVAASSSESVSFRIDLDGVTAGYYTIPVTADWADGTDELTASLRVKYEEETVETYNPAVKVSHTFDSSDGIVAGRSNDLSLSVQNKGDTALSALEVTLSSLPDGLTLDNAGTSYLIGTLGKNSTKTAQFPILADNDLESGSYPIGITITGKDAGGSAASFTQTLYVPVKSGGSRFISDIAIAGIAVPDQVNTGQDFTLSFTVSNKGVSTLENIRVSALGGEGVINKTKNIFIEPTIAAGGSKTYTITFQVPAKSEERYYPIELDVRPASGADASDSSVTQYTGVFASSAYGSGTPQLIVGNYSYGGSFVQAGDNIRLALTLYNTSAQDLQNIKITLTAEDGTFIPYNSSNSFFIEGIPGRSKATRDIALSVKPTAEQKTSAINVKMSYESKSGSAYDSEDIISIPVMQETRLVVDDIIAPPDLFAGQPMSVSVQFYNMGKTVLNNLRVSAAGNFTLTDSASYYVGNMEAGKNDYYDLGFIPDAPGQMTGMVTFTFEDQSGNEQSIVKEFSFDVMDMPIMPEDPGMIPPEEGGPGKWPYIIGVLLAAAAAIGFVIFRKIRRKKHEKAMEMQDE